MSRRVCVIGGGSSGLTSIKSCLEEGLEPTCFESSDDIGGLWRFKVRRTAASQSVLISSTMTMTKNIFLQVKPRPDFSRSGQWDVETENKKGEKEKHIFDAVMICIGHHCHPNLPLHDFPGIDTFKGQYFHSRDYKTAEEWRGKRVVVIGIGNSGGDIAVELSRVTKQVFLSTRRGAWILNRVGRDGVPIDFQFSRVLKMVQSVLPFGLVCRLGENKVNQRFNHSLYSLQPKHRLFSQHPTVNDELPNRILSGTVQVKSNIRRIQGSSIEFDDGTVEDNIDLVVFATGYNFSFPFLPSSMLPVSGNKANLYKYMFPPGLERPTLAVIGLVQPLGAIMPISEMQARWATRVFKGLNTLPSMDCMLKDIKHKEETIAKRYVTSQRHTIQVEYIDYMDQIAYQVGVRPSLLGLLLRDPGVWLCVLLGPCAPYQYRLRGPGQWDGARQAILTTWDRMAGALKTRPLDIPEPKQSSLPLTLTMGAAALALGYYWNIHNHPSLLKALDPTTWQDKIKPYLPGLW
uniref:Flavin-containing monooxygenase n=1 Tax=Salmo trutta TaxID=8032 RepID=A0A673W6J2_SALTR